MIVSLLAVLAFAGPPQRNPSNHCLGGVETVLFHCALKNGKWLDICADNQSATPTHVQYRFGAKGAIELQKPDISADNLSAWTFAESALPRGMQRTASFVNEGHTYEVFVTEAGPDTQAGLTVRKGDSVIATLTCADQTFDDNLSAMTARP